jgi:hypothetical protein
MNILIAITGFVGFFIFYKIGYYQGKQEIINLNRRQNRM